MRHGWGTHVGAPPICQQLLVDEIRGQSTGSGPSDGHSKSGKVYYYTVCASVSVVLRCAHIPFAHETRDVVNTDIAYVAATLHGGVGGAGHTKGRSGESKEGLLKVRTHAQVVRSLKRDRHMVPSMTRKHTHTHIHTRVNAPLKLQVEPKVDARRA